jgi:ribosome-associated protein YbcJ (S4-like RNA binding protein)
MDKCNVILTGIPRSGTSLACHLLNKIPDTVALVEPLKIHELKKLPNPEMICDEVKRFFLQTRESIITNGKAISRQKGGKILDNTFGDQFKDRGIRKLISTKGEITIDKPLAIEFLLCIKHTMGFAKILESLVKRFPCFALIRNPLSVFVSWSTVNRPRVDENSPGFQHFDAGLRRSIKQAKNKTDRQLCLLSWFFETFQRLLPDQAILRYEDMISSGGRALSVISPHANTLDGTLENRNKNQLYNPELMQRLGEKLLNTDGAYWDFYSRESVEMLLNN